MFGNITNLFTRSQYSNLDPKYNTITAGIIKLDDIF